MVPWSLCRATADSCAREAHACTWACVAVHQVPVLTANAMLGGTYHTFVHTASQTVRKRSGLALRVHAPSPAMLLAVRAAGILALAVPPCLGFRPWPAMVDASHWLFAPFPRPSSPTPPPLPVAPCHLHPLCVCLPTLSCTDPDAFGGGCVLRPRVRREPHRLRAAQRCLPTHPRPEGARAPCKNTGVLGEN